jgi:phytoene synthase
VTTTALVAAGPAAEARTTIAVHSKSFALASKVLGRRLRDQTAVVYTWCRRADDAVDLAADRDHAIAALAGQRADLERAFAGTAADPVLAAFGEVARARAMPRAYPDALLDGMAMDVDGARYATVDDLLGYCWRAAGVVGLMMTHVFGVKDDRALPRAAALGIAMQLTNICRDVAEDWGRGRLYIPDELLAAHGGAGLAAELGGPLPATARAPLAGAVGDLLALADGYYRLGDRGVRDLPWRAALAVRAARRVYSAIGRRVAATGHDVTAGRVFVPRAAKLAHVGAALGRTLLDTPVRAGRAMFGARARVPAHTLELADVPRP